LRDLLRAHGRAGEHRSDSGTGDGGKHGRRDQVALSAGVSAAHFRQSVTP
jgi:hypothetical protein